MLTANFYLVMNPIEEKLKQIVIDKLALEPDAITPEADLKTLAWTPWMPWKRKLLPENGPSSKRNQLNRWKS